VNESSTFWGSVPVFIWILINLYLNPRWHCLRLDPLVEVCALWVLSISWSVTMLIQRSGVILYSMSRWIHVLLDKRRSWVWVRDRHWSRCKATEARLWFTQRQLTQFQWTCCTSYSAAGQLNWGFTVAPVYIYQHHLLPSLCMSYFRILFWVILIRVIL